MKNGRVALPYFFYILILEKYQSGVLFYVQWRSSEEMKQEARGVAPKNP